MSECPEVLGDTVESEGEDLRQRLAEEGRSARNLLIWNVPLDDGVTSGDTSPGKFRKPPLSPRSLTSKLLDCSRQATKRSVVSGKPRVRSVSAGRDSKLDFQARYWAFLFENLRRAVDEIYETCGTDESIAECKEAIMVLDNYTKDFHSLIEWIHLKRDFDSTPPRSRPTSLAWEIRRPSSRINLLNSAFENLIHSPAVRTLKFDEVILPKCSLGVQTDDAFFVGDGSLKPELAPIPDAHSAETCHQINFNDQQCGVTVNDELVATVPTVLADTVDRCNNNGLLDIVKTIVASESVIVDSTTVNDFEIDQICEVVPPLCVLNTESIPCIPPNTTMKQNKNSPVKDSAMKANDLTLQNGFQRRSVLQSTPIQSNGESHKSNAVSSCGKTFQQNVAKLGAVHHKSIGRKNGNALSYNQSLADKRQGNSSPVVTSTSASKVLSSVGERNTSNKDDDVEGWETVQRVRSKSRLSPPSKIVKSLKVSNQSNSIGGLDMSKTKTSPLNQSPPNALQHTKEVKCKTRYQALMSQSNAATTQRPSTSSLTSSKPKPAKSLPSLHLMKSPENSASKAGLQNKQKPSKVSSPKNGVSVRTSVISDTKRVKDGLRKLSWETVITKNGKNNRFTMDTDCNKRTSAQVKVQNSSFLSVNKNSCSSVTSVNNNVIREVIDKSNHKNSGSKNNANITDCVKPLDISENSVNNHSSFKSLESKMATTSNLCQTGHDVSSESCDDDDDDGMSSEMFDAATATDGELPFMCGMQWGDYMDYIDTTLRPPGRVLKIHEKLSSPSRKRPLCESIRRHEEKQAKAQEQREKFLEEKAQKGKEISKKVEEKRQWKEEITLQRRLEMERKLLRAEEKRRMQLQIIVRKAHDEEEKVNEIAFINTLEAQIKRHDVLSRIQGHEARLLDIQEERQRRQEEKAAKEAAAEERRRALEVERLAKLVEMQEKRKQKEFKIEQHQQEREKERQELAREKARDREERLWAIQAAHQATMEELQKKIQQKQEESARRHEENIEHIRQKALELSILRISAASDDAPRLVPYDRKKLCALCNVLISSEVFLSSHLRGKKHQQAIRDKHKGVDPSREETESYNLKNIIEAPADNINSQLELDKVRIEQLKFFSIKVKNEMSLRAEKFETLPSSKLAFESSNKAKIAKCVTDMSRCLSKYGLGPWPTDLLTIVNRSIGDMLRLINKKGQTTQGRQKDQQTFHGCGGLLTIHRILNFILNGTAELPTVVPSKTLVNICTLYCVLCEYNRGMCLHLLCSNKVTVLLELLIHRLDLLIPDNAFHLFMGTGGSILTSLPVDDVAQALMHLLTTIWKTLTQDSNSSSTELDYAVWVRDVGSYAVTIGIVDKLSQYFSNIRGPIDSDVAVSEFVQQGLDFLFALMKVLSCCSSSKQCVFEKPKPLTEDAAVLVDTMQITELVGSVSLLYGMLLHTGALSRGLTPPPQLPLSTLSVTISALCMLNHFAVLDIQMFQFIIGGEGISLEFRHIVSYLLWYCSHWTNDSLLNELILIVGYFSALNQDNQTVIQSGHMPTVLQQLCLLPFQYFSDPILVDILFPTLVACCFDNVHNSEILEQEVSCELLGHYIEEKILDLDKPVTKKKHQDVDLKLQEREDPTFDVDYPRWDLDRRFPRSRWDEAQQFFHSA